jgi:hypothetical protein
MSVAEKIAETLRGLPESAQAEVLDFVEFLKSRTRKADDAQWSAFSIEQAIRGMESEPELYSEKEIKEAFPRAVMVSAIISISHKPQGPFRPALSNLDADRPDCRVVAIRAEQVYVPRNRRA